MALNKQPGTLRDFRIDASANSETSDHNAANYKAARPKETPNQRNEAIPKQSIRNRSATIVSPRPLPPSTQKRPELISSQPNKSNKASITEWSRSEDLWSSWEKDQDTQNSRKELKENLELNTQDIAVHQKTSNSNLSLAIDGLENTEGQLNTDNAAGSVPWPVELAMQERRAERLGVVDFASSYQKQEILKKLTLEFMTTLRKGFQEQIEIFNDARRSPAQNIQLYRVSGTAEDFMVFRNGVKLVVSGQRAGRILLAFNQFLGQIFAPRIQGTYELEASWGAFDQIYWGYRGDRVQLEDVIRYFMSEFCRQSFR
jgi:hypothetical protein